jgi:hypothetical protein
MTIDLDELERLEREATEGPWGVSDFDGAWCAPVESPVLSRLAGALGNAPEGPQRVIGHVDLSAADEALCLALRNAAPELIRQAREVERLRERAQRMREALREAGRFFASGPRAYSMAEVDRLMRLILPALDATENSTDG